MWGYARSAELVQPRHICLADHEAFCGGHRLLTAISIDLVRFPQELADVDARQRTADARRARAEEFHEPRQHVLLLVRKYELERVRLGKTIVVDVDGLYLVGESENVIAKRLPGRLGVVDEDFPHPQVVEIHDIGHELDIMLEAVPLE